MDTPTFKKQRVLDHFGSVAATARFFDVEVQAVYQWPESAIPEGRAWELAARLPHVFGRRRKSRKAA